MVSQCNVIIHRKTSVVVCLWIYAVDQQGHISQENIREWVKKTQNFTLEHFAFTVHTAIAMLAIAAAKPAVGKPKLIIS